MTIEDLLDTVAELAALRMFPSDPAARAAIAKDLLAMCERPDQAQWLVGRMRQLFNEWPGPREMRAVFCSRFKPKDGIEAYSADPRFIESGIPPESPQLDPGEERRALAPAAQRLLDSVKLKRLN